MSAELERTPLLRDAHYERTRCEKRAFLSRYVVKDGVGAELGVLWGHFSEVIIREFQPRTLYLVDLWDLQGESFRIEGKYADFGRLRPADCHAHVKEIEARHPGIVTVVKDDASHFLAAYEGEPFDWVYVDTSHTYDATLRELTLIAEHLKPGGAILGDDWIADPSHPHYEVVQAVHTFVRGTEFEIVLAGRGHQFVLRRGRPLRRSRPAGAPVAPPTRPSPEVVVQKLHRLVSRPGLAIEIVTGRASANFSASMDAALTRELAPAGAAVTLRDLTEASMPCDADAVLLIGHAHREESAYLEALRESGYAGVVVAWLWDNHHAKERNRRVAELVDITIAAHDCHAGYLAKVSLLFRSVMLGSGQWTSDEARALWALVDTAAPRSSDLYGGFGRYKGSERTARLEQLIATGRYPAVYFVDAPKAGGYFDYFALSSEERFRHWTRYAVSLCLPYRNDLGLRFFDAWLTGQIPVVTPDIPELQSDWAKEHRDRDFVVAAGYEPADIDAAHARALELFRAGGSDAQHARHRLAIEHHLFRHRVERILDLLRQAGEHGIETVLRP